MSRWLSIGLHLAVYGSGLVLVVPTAGGSIWALVFGGLLIWISVVDLERYEIPDAAVLALVLAGTLWLYLAPDLPKADHLLGGVLWPLLIWSVAGLYARVRGWNGLGFGDVKLMAGLGLWAGFEATIFVLLAASLAGIFTLLSISVLRRTTLKDIVTSAIAFGPFLCLSAWVIWLRGQG